MSAPPSAIITTEDASLGDGIRVFRFPSPSVNGTLLGLVDKTYPPMGNASFSTLPIRFVNKIRIERVTLCINLNRFGENNQRLTIGKISGDGGDLLDILWDSLNGFEKMYPDHSPGSAVVNMLRDEVEQNLSIFSLDIELFTDLLKSCE